MSLLSGFTKGTATGATVGSVVPVIGTVAGGIIGGVGGLVQGATTSDPETGKVNKQDFYAQRDAWYAQITALYGYPHHEQLPGNPFAQFSHGVIRDSPFKNYSLELIDLTAMVKKHYPELFAEDSTTPTPAPDPSKTGREPTVDENGDRVNGKGMAIPVWVWVVGLLLLLTGGKIFK